MAPFNVALASAPLDREFGSSSGIDDFTPAEESAEVLKNPSEVGLGELSGVFSPEVDRVGLGLGSIGFSMDASVL